MMEMAREIERHVDLAFLDPRRIRFFRHGSELRMTIEDDRTYLRVTAARAFPLSDPEHYIGVFELEGPEIGLIRDLKELDRDSRAALEEELKRRYFTPVVTTIYEAKTEFGSVYWDVDTDKGRRQFIVRNIRENVFEVSPNRYLIQDVDGNRFEIRDTEALDSKSRAKLERLF